MTEEREDRERMEGAEDGASSERDHTPEGGEEARTPASEGAESPREDSALGDEVLPGPFSSVPFEQTEGHLVERIREIEEEKQRLSRILSCFEKENEEMARMYEEIEEENHRLVTLYVSSQRLHSTLDIEEVLGRVSEIMINLVGAEEFTILLLDDKTQELKPVAMKGVDKEAVRPVLLGEGIIGKAALSGKLYFAQNDAKPGEEDVPAACIPLQVQERLVGALVVFQLLPQKVGFSDLDHELFTMLGGHAASAILAAKLYSDSERKLSTIQGFIELLSK